MHNKGFSGIIKWWQNEGRLRFHKDACPRMGMLLFLSSDEWFWGTSVLGVYLLVYCFEFYDLGILVLPKGVVDLLFGFWVVWMIGGS